MKIDEWGMAHSSAEALAMKVSTIRLLKVRGSL